MSPLSGPTPPESISPLHPLEHARRAEEPSVPGGAEPAARSLGALLVSGALSRRGGAR